MELGKEVIVDPVTYTYTDISGIRLTRTRSGQWSHHFKAQDMFDHANKGRVKRGEPPFSMYDKEDIFEVGMALGYRLSKLYERCQEQFNDKTEDNV